VLILGSDVWEYPYYLLSVEQMLKDAAKRDNSICDLYGDEAQRDTELVDPAHRRHFANGSAPMLRVLHEQWRHIAALPGFRAHRRRRGGAMVRYLHDPDSYAVIAADFDSYLRSQIDRGYAFVNSDEA